MLKIFLRRNASTFNSEVPYLKNYRHNIKVDEIEMKLPSGNLIAGKWWGDRSLKPFICLHGWQDNAGSFNRLIPLLPQQFSYLAIDFPGHGKSSWVPNGVPYQSSAQYYHLHEIINHLKFDKVGLMAHSVGGWTAFNYAALFPNKIEMLITFDTFKKFNLNLSQQIRAIASCIKNFEKSDQKVREGMQPPTYTLNEMINKVHEGCMGNVWKESAVHLLERNIAESEDGKFYFTRDNRLWQMAMLSFPHELILQMAKEMQVPLLFLSAADENPFYAKSSFYDEFIEIASKKENLEVLNVASNSHYFHLNEAEKISKPVSEFILKHGKVHRL